MNMFTLAIKNIAGSAFRSTVVFICALLVAGFALTLTLLIRGAESSLELAMNRMGADIIVVPAGSETRLESALLMGTPAKIWMPASNLEKVAAIEDVTAASPQLYLSTLHNAFCCTVPDMFLVAFDPKTDFTILPWLEQTTGTPLKLGDAIGGRYVFTPTNEEFIKLYNYSIRLVANMEPTGTRLDQSMFFTFDTAQAIAKESETAAEEPMLIPQGQISSVMVKVKPGVPPITVVSRIKRMVPGVTPIENQNLFQSYRRQMEGLINTILIVMVAVWVLLVLMIALVFSLAANERRREMGVLRAMGASRAFIFRSLLSEAWILAFDGGVFGALLAALLIYFLRRVIIDTLSVPFIFPSVGTLLLEIGGGLLLAMLSITLAALIPAFRISFEEPANAMRE
jgi:putative ABC transport system permease protein